MNKFVGVMFLVAGACLLAYGLNAAESVASDFSRFFDGTPTNKSLMLLILGGILLMFGISFVAKKESA